MTTPTTSTLRGSLFIFLGATICLAGLKPHIKLIESQLTFISSDGKTLATINVGTNKSGGFLPIGDGGTFFRLASISRNQQRAVVVENPAPTKPKRVDVYGVDGTVRCSIKGGKYKWFDGWSVRHSPSGDVFALSKENVLDVEGDLGVPDKVELESGEPPDGVLLFGYDCKLIFSTSWHINPEGFSPKGRYLMFSENLIDVAARKEIDIPKSYTFAGIGSDREITFCHIVRAKGCVNYLE